MDAERPIVCAWMNATDRGGMILWP